MKSLIVSIGLIFCISLTGNTQDFTIPLGRSKTEDVVLQNSYSNLLMSFSLQKISGNHYESRDNDAFVDLYFGNGYNIGEIGTPKLPAFKRLIQIPIGAEVDVRVLAYSEDIIKLNEAGISNPIVPVQPSIRKDMDIDDVPFEYSSESYAKEGFKDYPIATIEVLGTMRGARIARLVVAPVDYDPVNSQIKVYNDIEVEIIFEGVDQKLNNQVRAKTFSPYFEPIYNMFANSYTRDVYDDHPDLTSYPVRMLMIADRMFEETLEPYIAWKTKKGFYVEVAYTDDIGTSSSAIQSYVHDAYNNATPENPAPSFLVIVGDTPQIPASATGSSSGKATDLYYASVDGDYFPEMYYGRMSARTVEQLENIISKILYYEQYQFDDPTYLNNTTLIAGVDGNWNPKVGEPTIKYGTENYFNQDNGFSTVWGYGVANDPNNPNNSSGYSGCYDNERISVSFINYTAHCYQGSWSDPSFTVEAAHNTTNFGKFPLAVGNCCLSADFGYSSETIGEAWIRAENKGAVTYIGSSPNSYWFEDFYWAVGAFPISGTNDGYVPTFEETTFGAYDGPFHSDYITAGGKVFIGNLAVTEVDIQNYPSHSSPLYYWQAYNVLGDPSVVHYLTEGTTNTVNHMDIVPIGLETYTVSALPGSYVAVSKDGVLHGAALVGGSGEVDVPIDPILDGGDVDIVVTRPQTQPYMAQVPAAALEGPFLVLDDYVINDETENDNGEADYGESFTIHVTLKNVGADNATGVNATLTGMDEHFTITNAGPVGFGDIDAGEAGNTSTVSDAFSLSLSDDVPDQYQATFVIEITDGEETWESNISFVANAPVLSIGGITIDDGDQGIPGILDPGETADAVISVSNTGNATSPSISALLSTGSEWVTINDAGSIDLGSLNPGASTDAVFSITADENTEEGTPVTLNLNLEADQYEASKSLDIVVGEIPEFLMTNGEVTACIGLFYDSGGPEADYSNNENYTMTFYPDNEAAMIRFQFTSFDVESHSSCNYDKLSVYDGPNTDSPLIGEFCGSTVPSALVDFVSTHPAGAITFHFTSDVSVPKPGWEASFSCEIIEYSIEAIPYSDQHGHVTGSGIYQHGESVELQAFPYEGYRFVSWTVNEEEVSAANPYQFVAEDDVQVIAVFELIDYEISFVANPEEGGSISSNPQQDYYNFGDEISITANPAAGYEFVNWTGNTEGLDDTNSANPILTMPAADISLTANFQLIDYNVAATVYPEGAGSVTGTGTYNMNDIVDLQAIEDNVDFEFLNWRKDGQAISSENPYQFIMPTEDVDLIAYYIPEGATATTLTLEVNPAGAGSTSGAGEYLEGDEVIVSANINSGYEFINWTDPLGETVSTEKSFAYTIPDADVTLTANFVKILDLEGLIANNKVYDGTTAASISNYGTLDGLMDLDHDVTLETSSVVATFDNKNVSAGKKVTVAGLSLSGSDSDKYIIYDQTTSANITPKDVNIIDAVAADKIYDGTTDAIISDAKLDGIIVGDIVEMQNHTSGTFAVTSVGNDITVSTGITLLGTDAINYTAIQPNNLTASITHREIDVVNAEPLDKQYDGTNVATITGAEPTNIIAGDEVVLDNHTEGVFAQIGLGTDISVTTSITISGTDASNYIVNQPTGLEADITARLLIIDGTYSVEDKVYDGTEDAIVSEEDLTLLGVIDEEEVLIESFNVAFVNANADQEVAVDIVSLDIIGADVANYSVSLDDAPEVYAAIIPKDLTLNGTFTVDNKVYDGTTEANIDENGLYIEGVLEDDEVLLDDVTIQFEDASVGENKTVIIISGNISGAQSNNYNISVEGAPLGTANITAKEITIGGSFTVEDKIYDGTASATIVNNNLTLTGLISGDLVNLIDVVAEFAQAEVGSNILVSIVDADVIGDDAFNYSLSLDDAPTTTASILEPPTYTLSLVVSPENTGTVSGEGDYHEGENIDITASPEEGFMFLAWMDTDENLVSSEPDFTFEMPAADITLTARFVPCYPVTFHVMCDQEEPIDGAMIMIGDEHEVFTGADGEAAVEMADGHYAFTVIVEGYEPYEGELTVDGEAIEVTVQMQPVGAEHPVLANLRVYPNPFSNSITLDNAEDVNRITITNLIGQKVMDMQVSGSYQLTIQTEKLEKGIYLITLYAQNGEKLIRKMIKQ